ncbi:hypothetical protein ASPZODRAFT_1370324 [Penicilliopsis zonata CBS 506.65]|uniref:Major facilitator superfamily (MFS) profile domain-containing protein n=1 Tax=Penicilliopsis zonata CBS 506.65 TaxID=1073090 RepID=A0A1L9SPK6_9EURO|nr:hypothetical protein ASPZODRAFT_1370324 [Penicilliopsis zonata CBS 506.65]OJJ48994.1 hypothetical protein ASPZODRAFT_1370324 [Penicilliopsis zonata CBS 506.65]
MEEGKPQTPAVESVSQDHDSRDEKQAPLDARGPSDPNNPQYWSESRKRRMLVVLCVAALLTDWGMTWGSPLFESQAVYWNMTAASVSSSLSGGVFLQGAGGLFAVPLTQRFGRLPVLFWSQFLSCVVVIGCALARNFAGFTAARTVEGLVNTAPQIIGLSIIHDMYSFSERTRKINIWSYAFLAGPFMGPFCAALIITRLNWRQDFGILAAMYGFSFLLTACLGEETLYDAETLDTPKTQPQQKKSVVDQLKVLTGITGIQAKGRPGVFTVLKDTFSIGLKPHVLIISMTYYMFVTMWSVGLATTIPELVVVPPLSFGAYGVALLYLAPAIGGFFGEIWGHFFNDWLCNSYLRKHNGVWVPERRLWAFYPAAVFAICSMVLIGESLGKGLHWVALAFGWAMYNAATVTATTAISAYMMDCFPKHVALVSSIVNFWRTTGGFCVVYFQLQWVALNGAAVVFGCQAAIIAAGFAGVIITQVWGQGWREKYPPPPDEN